MTYLVLGFDNLIALRSPIFFAQYLPDPANTEVIHLVGTGIRARDRHDQLHPDPAPIVFGHVLERVFRREGYLSTGRVLIYQESKSFVNFEVDEEVTESRGEVRKVRSRRRTRREGLADWQEVLNEDGLCQVRLWLW